MKEHLRETFRSFFIITTLICTAMFILGIMFRPDQKFGYEVFIYPLIYGAVGSIPGLIMYSDKELSVTQLIVRKAIQLLMLVVLVPAMIFAGTPVTWDLAVAISGVALSVVVIFVAVHLIEWVLDRKTAAGMTADLKEWKKREGM